MQAQDQFSLIRCLMRRVFGWLADQTAQGSSFCHVAQCNSLSKMHCGFLEQADRGGKGVGGKGGGCDRYMRQPYQSKHEVVEPNHEVDEQGRIALLLLRGPQHCAIITRLQGTERAGAWGVEGGGDLLVSKGTSRAMERAATTSIQKKRRKK